MDMAASTALSLPLSQGTEYFWGISLFNSMMNDNHSTRVQAPDSSSATDLNSAGVSSARNLPALMTPVTQTSPGGGSRQTQRDGSSSFSGRTRLDISCPIRLATWNTLTLNKIGYVEAAVNEFANMDIRLAGLTETRLTGNGELLLQDYSLLYSGGDQHVHGVALLIHTKVRQLYQAMASYIRQNTRCTHQSQTRTSHCHSCIRPNRTVIS